MGVVRSKIRLGFGGAGLFALLMYPGLTQARTSIGKAGEARTPDPSAEAGGPILDGTMIDVTRCPSDRFSSTRRCGDVLGLAITETRSDLSNFRFVEQPAQNFQTFLEPPACDIATHDAEIEVRRYEGRPFAVIQRVECRNASTQKLTAFHVVRGLPGFEALSSNIEASNAGGRAKAMAEAKAQQRADGFLMALWPVLQANLKKERDSAIDQAFAAQIKAQRAERRKRAEDAAASVDVEESDAEVDQTADEGEDAETEETTEENKPQDEAAARPANDKEIVVIIDVNQ